MRFLIILWLICFASLAKSQDYPLKNRHGKLYHCDTLLKKSKDVRNLLKNDSEAYQYYKRSGVNTALSIPIGLAGVGFLFAGISEIITIDAENAGKFLGIGFGMMLIGGGLGYLSRNQRKKAINTYNQNNIGKCVRSSRLKAGFNENGLAIIYQF